MGLKWKPRRMRVAAVLAVAMLVPGVALGSAVLFSWTGEDAVDNNRTSPANWGTTDYPGKDGSQVDSVIIDDTNPRATMVQDTDDLTVATLFVGDGHTIQLDNWINVLNPHWDPEKEDTGRLEFEGEVNLKGTSDKRIEADFILIYTMQETTVTFETDGGGTGMLYTNNN